MRPERSEEEERVLASGVVPALGRVDFLEAEDLLDALHDAQLALSDGLDELGRVLAERALPEPPERAAVAAVRDALAVFLLAVGARPVPRAFLPESALARYLVALHVTLRATLREASGGALVDAPLPDETPVRRELIGLGSEVADVGSIAELTAAFARLAGVVKEERAALA